MIKELFKKRSKVGDVVRTYPKEDDIKEIEISFKENNVADNIDVKYKGKNVVLPKNEKLNNDIEKNILRLKKVKHLISIIENNKRNDTLNMLKK